METNATKIQCQVQYDFNGICALQRLDLNEAQCQVLIFARDLWKTLQKIDVKTIADEHNEPIH